MTKDSKSDLWISIINLHSNIQKGIGGALSVHGLGVSKCLVLQQLFIATNQKIRRVDLAEKMGLSPSGITRDLNPMEKIGLIGKEQNPRDARVSLVALSSPGKRVYAEAKTAFEYASIALREPLDSKQVAVFVNLVKAVG